MQARHPEHEWFPDSPFNMIVDYYTEVPSRPYGSGATRENVLPVLRDLKIGYIIIYAKGHSGYTTFPSSLKTEHIMLGQDMPKAFREMTRETGTRLFFYYSGLLDGIAGLRYPDWCMLNMEGKPQQYFTEFGELFLAYGICPLSDYFEKWVSVHMKELITRYDPDGFWIDGDWGGPCFCPRCMARFRAETGFETPSMDASTPEGAAWLRCWSKITHEWRMRFASFIKSLKPSCMYSAGNVSPRKEWLEPFDWRSGDWFSPNNHRLSMSISARRYTTLGIPYDAFTCDTCFVHSRPRLRARGKTLPRMLQEGATLLANGSTWGYWTYPMPNGAFIPSKIRMAKKASDFAYERKDCCLHTEPVRWTAILATKPGGLFDYAYWGAGKSLIATHRSPVIIDESDLMDDMPYDLIVLPEQPVLTTEIVAKLEKFVADGGKLLSTGVSIQSPEFQKLLGVRLVKRGVVNDGHVILKNDNPAGVFAPWDQLELDVAKELYPLYMPWDYYNPETRKIPLNYPITGMLDEENPEKAGFPAATVRELGKGLAVHIPTDFFHVYWTYGNPDMLSWFREILDFLQPDPLFKTDALSFVEVVLRLKRDSLLVHLVNGNPGRDMSLVGTDDLWVDDIPPVGPITCWIRCAEKPGKVTLEPGGTPTEGVWENGILRVVLPKLEIHNCIAIKNWRVGQGKSKE